MLKHPIAFLIAGAIGVGGLLAGSPATAGHTERQTIAIRVTSTGLDLNDSDGAGAMLSRIRSAAREACDFEEADSTSGCVRDKVDDAVARLGNPMVTAVSHGGR